MNCDIILKCVLKQPAYLIVLLVIFVAGCAANQPTVQAPSPQELAWANKMIALDEQQKALQQQQQDLNRQKQELNQSKVEEDSAKQDAQAKIWLAQNKDQIERSFTTYYQTNGQAMLEAYGFNGTYLDCMVDAVAIDDGTFIASEVILWKNSDGSGEGARINVEYDMHHDWSCTGSSIVSTKHFSADELATVMNKSVNPDFAQNNEQASVPTQASTDNKSSIWAPTSDTVNTMYKAAGVAAVGLFAEWIKNQMDSGN